MRTLLLLILLLAPPTSHAAVFGITPASEVARGQVALITFTIDTEGEMINAVSGSITLPDGAVLTGVSYEGSLVPLWVEEPEEREAGTVSFAGIFPGGFDSRQSLTGRGATLATLAVRMGGAESAEFAYSEDTSALLNDGRGTEAVTTLSSRLLRVVASGTDALLPSDTVPPESFVVETVSGELVGREGRVLIFGTSDKGSGIARYELSRSFFPLPDIIRSWRSTESPESLSMTDLFRVIRIRAVDEEGNTTAVTAYPGGWTASLPSLVILILVSLVLYFLIRRAIMKK
jgi:hypothetical protein